MDWGDALKETLPGNYLSRQWRRMMPTMCIIQTKLSHWHISAGFLRKLILAQAFHSESILGLLFDFYLLERSSRTPGLPFFWAELGGESSQSLDELQVVQHLHHAAEVLCAGEGKATLVNHSCIEIQSRKHSIWPQWAACGMISKVLHVENEAWNILK